MIQAFEWLKHQFEITFIVDNRYKLFVTGITNTFTITIGALIIGIVLGALVAIVRVYNARYGRMKILNAICGAYLAIFRGTPIVVQLLIMYYIIFVFINNGIIIAIIAFGINSGAYVAEVVRAGIMAVDIGQTEAGRSLGLSQNKTMRLIVLPQAIKNILPALGNEFITLLKETSVAGYVAIRDLTRAGENIRVLTMEPYFSLLFVALIYFLIVMLITRLLRLLERRLSRSDRS
ncbi:MAG: amino acid ABC transporter permease [Treponema sp.]|nr:amino acid ABC transporter permease [Treponema sp.]